MNPAPLIGIVTVLYNSDDLLLDFFDSLARQSHSNFILYSIDNSTTDSGTRRCEALAAERGIKCIAVFNGDNVGVAQGNNQGIKLAITAGCEYILLANNDILFTDANIFACLLTELVARGYDAIVPKILYHAAPHQIWFAGGRLNEISVSTEHVGIKKNEDFFPCDSEVTSYAPTCFMLVRKTVFEQIGLMRELYFVYYDDTDFSYRIAKHGLRIGIFRKPKIWHKVSFSTGGDESEFSLYFFFRNRILFAKYNYDWPKRIVAIFYILMAATIKTIKYPKRKSRAVRRGIMAGLKEVAYQGTAAPLPENFSK